VFIIFQRLHARDEFGGAGIGLTICKKIIDNLNGKIWIEDSPLGGTRVCFTIPK
jgi:signal transduction histidine kinase